MKNLNKGNLGAWALIIIAILLTLILLTAFAWLLNQTSTCPDGQELIDRLACLEPNAIGDTSAGAFAPVAFIWLVTAVLLQRSELAAQRQELKDSREVAEAQVLEARNNVAFMAEQTQLLVQRDKAERQEQIDRELRDYELLPVRWTRS
ncbi:hypothetical protein NIM87_11450 [Devosia sp. XJ19-1]|uniref:Uncharacterized protein n=1 Tax=Devosia ureilytica TaxID=2952754 RepID=A0A9Q4AP04_9HYPH|nr:hypothetical protein [Devosia ureilytica]MCP8884120.1 hypothetical protein [Devosia ureilytica]MCP8887728.1 hypothetical protein [Devosia ureilytica]